MSLSLEELQAAFDKCIADGYEFFCHNYAKKMHVTLERGIYGSMLKMKVEGETVAEAFAACFANFPDNPLDGSRWKNARLAAPAEEAVFTEVPPVSPSTTSDDIPF